MTKKTTVHPAKWIFKIFKKFLPKTLLMCLCSILVSGLFIVMAFLSKSVLEVATGERAGNFTSYGIAFAVIIIAQVALSWFSAMLKASVSGKFTIAMREYLFTLLSRKSYPSLQQYHSGDILNRFTSDTEIVVTNTITILPDICSMLTKIIGGAVALIMLEHKIAFIVIILGIVFPAIGRLISRRYKHLHKECQKSEGATRSFLQECFQNNIVIKTFKSEIPFLKKLKQYMATNYRLKIKRALVSVVSHVSLYTFFTLGYYAILIWGAAQISKNLITYGTLLAFLQLVSQLRTPLQNISSVFPKYYSLTASAERLMELESLENESFSESLPADFSFTNITGSDISFSYNDKKVLSDFSFKIQKGSLTAITGASGIGKSTLFKLILGLYQPQSGYLTINGVFPANASTRTIFAYVPQGNMILSGSIKDNLTMYNSNIAEKDIVNACKTAEIHDYIASLPNGYDTVLNERGSGLSEGQTQRLAIARALIADTPVLLLDEATSALDNETELRLLQNIKALTEKTVILVTHRKASIDFCDNIISI